MATATPTRRLSLPAALLRSLLAAIVAERTPAESASLLRQAGYDAGEELYAMLQDELAAAGSGEASLPALPTSSFWKHFTGFWRPLGWGSLQHRQLHDAVAELASENWAEAEAAGQLGCQLTTGLFADLLSRVAATDVAVLEVECRARGEEHCRFLIGNARALTTLHAALLDGRPLDDALQQLG
jgi:predicted hydrocarbon binding protein